MATHEYLKLQCDKCRSIGEWTCVNHHNLQRMAIRAGWYRDAWTDLCPRCASVNRKPRGRCLTELFGTISSTNHNQSEVRLQMDVGSSVELTGITSARMQWIHGELNKSLNAQFRVSGMASYDEKYRFTRIRVADISVLQPSVLVELLDARPRAQSVEEIDRIVLEIRGNSVEDDGGYAYVDEHEDVWVED